jgi:hypothetical protein
MQLYALPVFQGEVQFVVIRGSTWVLIFEQIDLEVTEQ